MAPQKKRASPQKKKSELKAKAPTIKDLRKKNGATHTITVYAFDKSFKVEAYLYTVNDLDDGFLNGFRSYIEGAEGYQCPYMDAANFCYLWNHRVPNTVNEVMTNNKNIYWRRIMIRYLGGETSTPETRREGAETLRRFLLDTKYTNFPPKSIAITDGTNEDDPHALDEFFTDDKIEFMMKQDLDEAELDGNFYSRYTEFAQKIWSNPSMSRFANKYGFP